MKFLRCNHCGNIVTYIDEKTCIPSCCGEQMEVLAPNTTDAANEKHVPVCNSGLPLKQIRELRLNT